MVDIDRPSTIKARVSSLASHIVVRLKKGSFSDVSTEIYIYRYKLVLTATKRAQNTVGEI